MKLTEAAKRAIRRSFYTKIDKTLDAQAQARVYADHACSFLELDGSETKGWWESEAPSRKRGRCEGGHRRSVIGQRGDELVAVCQDCGTAHSERKPDGYYRPPEECLPPCSRCGLRLTELNPYSGLCMFFHEDVCDR